MAAMGHHRHVPTFENLISPNLENNMIRNFGL